MLLWPMVITTACSLEDVHGGVNSLIASWAVVGQRRSRPPHSPVALSVVGRMRSGAPLSQRGPT